MKLRVPYLWIVAIVSSLMFMAESHAQVIPDQLPDPDGQPVDSSKPVKVFILMGQSNMVGMGDISGGGTRWGSQFTDPVVSVYEGEYSPDTDYDSAEPVASLELTEFGGVNPTPFPNGGTCVVRGYVQMESTGVYRFKPGYQGSTQNIMEVDGKEVHRREVGEESQFSDIELQEGKRVPFKITFLTNDANGLGWIQRTDIPGTMETVVRQEGKFPHLVDEHGKWTVRNDVTYKGVISAVGQGPLTVGIQGNTIGPELGFGHVMGYYFDEPVLIVKASIGNRSLGWDILPPGSERFTFGDRVYAGYGESPSSWPVGTVPEPIDWYAGKQYDEYVEATHNVLSEFDSLFPDYRTQGYEIAGFVWWQGHKDGNEAHASRYEQNLVHLVNSLRKEFEAPNAPFVIGTIGFDGWELEGAHLKVAEAQLAVSGDTGKYPEFEGNVLTVETRDFWKEASESPKEQGYHYNRNAETYMRVGDAFGRAMALLLDERG